MCVCVREREHLFMNMKLLILLSFIYFLLSFFMHKAWHNTVYYRTLWLMFDAVLWLCTYMCTFRCCFSCGMMTLSFPVCYVLCTKMLQS